MAQQLDTPAQEQDNKQQNGEVELVQDESEEDKRDRKIGDRLLQEIRILLQGVQVLGGFLIVLPFNSRFTEVDPTEKWVYLATFISTTASMICFSAPATHQRLPLRDIDAASFKKFATTMIILGVVGLSFAVTLSTQFVIAFVFGTATSFIVTAIIVVLIGIVWWLVPQFYKNQGSAQSLWLSTILIYPALASCVHRADCRWICRVRRGQAARLTICPAITTAACAAGSGSLPTHRYRYSLRCVAPAWPSY